MAAGARGAVAASGEREGVIGMTVEGGSRVNEERMPYEPPVVTDYGTIEELTQGQLAVNLDDFPVGAKLIYPSGGPRPPGVLHSLPL